MPSNAFRVLAENRFHIVCKKYFCFLYKMETLINLAGHSNFATLSKPTFSPIGFQQTRGRQSFERTPFGDK